MFYNWDIAKEIAGEAERHNPQNATNNIETEEPTECHFTNTGYERGKGADDRHKTGNDNGFASMFFVKGVGF